MRNLQSAKEKCVPLKIDFNNDIEENKDFLRSKIKDQTILIIGAAGSIGSQYVKCILLYEPKRLVAVDVNENGLAELTRDLRSSALLGDTEYISYPVNLLSGTFEKIWHKHDYNIVANFSAHKHVRSEKDVISVEALMLNNIFGAIKLLKLCMLKPPSYFFSVSTDKAANPVNIMGASKSLMEKIILSKSKDLNVRTARFANVAFSNGSLLDGFVHRIRKNQPLSCPIDIKRFFVSEQQAGQICLLSTFLGDSGNVFFPKLSFQDDQIYFKDIGINFLKNLGFEPFICHTEVEARAFDIKKNSDKYPLFLFKTDTSGEKKYEEFYTNQDLLDLERHESLGIIIKNYEDINQDILEQELVLLVEDINTKKEDYVRFLKKYISDFEHIEKGKHLDDKM